MFFIRNEIYSLVQELAYWGTKSVCAYVWYGKGYFCVPNALIIKFGTYNRVLVNQNIRSYSCYVRVCHRFITRKTAVIEPKTGTRFLIYWMDFQWVMGLKKGQPQTRLSPCAGEGTRTHTLAHQILSLACLPISTHPQGLSAGESR